jgi:hypothetical protein
VRDVEAVRAWSSEVYRWRQWCPSSAGCPHVRKAPKDYGTCRLAEGGEVAGRNLAVIEDVVTSGGQLIESCTALRERGANIVGVLCVIDREAAAPRTWPLVAWSCARCSR